MRRASKVDDNQKRIVDALRRAGATVESLAPVGKGCPDLLVGFRGKTVLIEVKDGDKIPSKQRLRESQKNWHSTWRGARVEVVHNVEEAMIVVGLLMQGGK